MSEKPNILFINKIPGSFYVFGIFCVLFTALMVFVEINNGKFWTNDFKVYYEATIDFFSGNSPYEKAYGLGSGYFKYPPTTLFMFLVYIGLPYFIAQIIHISLLCIAYIISVTLIHSNFLNNIRPDSTKKYRGLLYLTFLFSVIHLVREFHMGNINLFLLVFFLLGLVRLKTSEIQTAIFWSLMVILKPIVILAFIPLLLYKKWNIILWMAGFGIFFFLVPIIASGWSGNLDLWINWFHAIGSHGDYIISENSLTYLTEYYLGVKSAWIPSLFVLAILAVFLLCEIQKSKFSQEKLFHSSIVLLAFTPNFFVTDTEHFLLSLPLIMILVKKLILFPKKGMWIPFIVFAACFSLNSNDLLGKQLSSFVSDHGFLGLANLGFIILYVVLSFLERGRAKMTPIFVK